MRLDQYLLEHEMARSRARAQSMIKAGKVCINGIVDTKPSRKVGEDGVVSLLEADIPYVSRSALKLKALLEATKFDVTGNIIIDIGASTGGFTQIMLEKGAEKIYSVDVGTGQLALELLQNKQVVNMQQTDARDLEEGMFSPFPTVLCSDVSFISITKILPSALRALPRVTHMFILIKPQFELEPEDIGKGGLVKSEELQQHAITKVQDCVKSLGFTVKHFMKSPIDGGDGNKEFLLYGVKN